MESQIEFVIELTEKDIAGMYDEISVRWRKKCLIPGIVVSIVAVALLFLRPDWFFESSADAAVWFIVFMLGFLLIYAGTFMVGAFRRAGVRRFRLSPSALVKTKYAFFDDHLTVTSDLLHSEIRWQAFLTRREQAGYLLLMTSATLGFIIPLAHLQPDQTLHLQEFVRSRIPALDKKAIYRIAFRRGQSAQS